MGGWVIFIFFLLRDSGGIVVKDIYLEFLAYVSITDDWLDL